MNKKVFLLITSLLSINCAIANDEAPPTEANENTIQITPAANNPIDFFDSEVFDLKLGKALLVEQPTVEVKVIAPFSVNQIPKRMDIWVSAIQNTDGNVETKPDPEFLKDRAFISEIIDLIVQVYKEVKQVAVYGVASNYNLTIFYKPNLGTVTKMVFTHR